jgi:hypothetical protein
MNPRRLYQIAEIEAARDLYPERVSGCKIYETPETNILKAGLYVKMEAEALSLVSTRRRVPVPQLYSAYIIGYDGYILVEKILGTALSQGWETMSAAAWESITKQLHQYVKSDVRSRDLPRERSAEAHVKRSSSSTPGMSFNNMGLSPHGKNLTWRLRKPCATSRPVACCQRRITLWKAPYWPLDMIKQGKRWSSHMGISVAGIS